MATEPRPHSVEEGFQRLQALRQQAAEQQEVVAAEETAEEPTEEFFEEPEVPEEVEAQEPLEESEEEPEEDDILPDLSTAGFNAEERELLSTLEPEVQQAIVRREQARDMGVQKQLGEVNAARMQLAEIHGEMAKARETYAAQVQTQLAVTADVQEPPEELLDADSEHYDPERYQLLDLRFRKAQRQRGEKEAELKKIQEEQVEELKQVQKAERVRASQKLVQHYPDWSDKDKFQAGVRKVREYLLSPQYDIKPEVAQNVFDADMLIIADKARRYDEMTSKQKPSRKAPKRVRSGGQPPAKPPTTDAIEAHKKLGTVDSAFAALKARDQLKRA